MLKGFDVLICRSLLSSHAGGDGCRRAFAEAVYQQRRDQTDGSEQSEENGEPDGAGAGAL